MIVVADTSPINYLILIDQINVLRVLFGAVAIPVAVERELKSPLAPSEVRDWMHTRAFWLDIRESPAVSDASLLALDAGEREAIALAECIDADLLMIDEQRGRAIATGRGFQIVGTLGILRMASEAGLLDLPNAVKRLQGAGFYVSKQVLEGVLGVTRK